LRRLAAVGVGDGHQQEGLARLGGQRRQGPRRSWPDLVCLRARILQPGREQAEKALIKPDAGRQIGK